MSVLETREIIKEYKKRRVVDGVSLSVATGAVVGLLGPNGAGKTTTFYSIAGFVRPDGGSVFLDGEEITRLPIHQRALKGLSYLPQEPSVFKKLTVRENIRIVLEPLGLAREEIRQRIDQLLEELKIDYLADHRAHSLSGGERRRVEIMRALAMNPRFILLDEPFAGIDPIAVIEIQRIIGFLKARGIGVLITDHNVRETLGICDHAFIISDGQVLARGTPSDLLRRLRLPYRRCSPWA